MINKIAKNLNISRKTNDVIIVIIIFLCYIFGLNFPETTIRVRNFFIHTIKFQKLTKIKIIHKVDIDTQLKSIKKLQRGRVVLHIEGRAILLQK